jgi:hypothetical protein
MEEIRCEDVKRKLEDFRHFVLFPPEKGRVERHLFYCSDCLNLLAAKSALDEPANIYSFS